jgi:hypothetical protein
VTRAHTANPKRRSGRRSGRRFESRTDYQQSFVLSAASRAYYDIILVQRWSPSKFSSLLFYMDRLRNTTEISSPNNRYPETRGIVVGRGNMLQAVKVAGSIPDAIAGLFNLPNPSRQTTAMLLT